MNNVHIGLIFLIILGSLVFVAIWLIYVARAYTEKAEALLSNSHFVIINKSALSHMGVVGEVMRSGVLAIVLMMPKISARRGIVNAAEVEKFPRGLKRMLVVSWGLGWLLSVVLVTFGVCVKSIK